MNWKKTRQADLPELILLLKKREWENLHFSSRIYNKGKPKIPGRKGSVFHISYSDGSLKAAVMVWDRCQIFPLFPAAEMTDLELQGLIPLIRQEAPDPFSLIGSAEAVQLLLDYLWLKPADLFPYRVMTLNGPYSEPGQGKLNLRLLTSSDLNALFPLEINYQKEEVLRHPERINLPYLKKIFSRQLKEQVMVGGKLHGQWVCKAATNAQGFRYYQLGGIYTSPEFRNQKLGEETLLFLLHCIERDKRNVSLFVKENNPAACKLYKKTGFEDRGRFFITYFS